MIMKRKSRYVLVMSSRPIEMSSYYHYFLHALSEQIGKIGLAKLDLSLAKSIGENLFIFKMSRGEEKSFILAISFVKRLREGEEEIGFYSLLTSGTISSIIRKYGARAGKA